MASSYTLNASRAERSSLLRLPSFSRLCVLACVGAFLGTGSTAIAALSPNPPKTIQCGKAVTSFRCSVPSSKARQMRKVKDRGRNSALAQLPKRCKRSHCARMPLHGRHAAAKVSGVGTDTLSSGNVLAAGQYLIAANGQYKFVMQGDGNLVLYTANLSRALWNSQTSGHPGSRAVMQSDGNVVIYDADGRALWSTRTAGNGGASLSVQSDGNVVLYSSSGQPLWNSGTLNSNAAPGDVLRANQYLTSANGQYKLAMQDDGNLVLYTANLSRALWNSQTSGHAGAYAVMQSDGNFVVYDSANQPLWYTRTSGNAGAALYVQTDGNLVVYGSAGQALWGSGTINSTARTGDVLTGGQYLTSPNGRYQLVMQWDGNLVLYAQGGRVVWHSHTAGNSGARLVVQADGNVVVYDASNHALFNTGTQNHPGARLDVQGDGNLVVYSGSAALWYTGVDQPPAAPREENAIKWATSLEGNQSYNWYCAKFVANAFGASAYGYSTAWEGAVAWGMNPGAAPRGALVFFAPDQSNRNAGHVGISLGDGRMISAQSNGVRTSSYTDAYWGPLYRGWHYAPSSWPGR
jgi:cell wall-associated NlpC family hydrolase